MKKSIIQAAIAVAVAAVSFGATAAPETLTPYKGKLPAVLSFAKASNGLETFKKIPVADGLDGWVVQDKQTGKHLVVFTTKDGEYLLAGMMVDKTGKNKIAELMEAHVPAPDYGQALSEFNAAPSVVLGSKTAKAELTIAFDANCGFCKIMHRLITPAIDAGELRVRYVPVAILGADSNVKAAGVLQSKNPRAEIDAAAMGRGVTTSSDKEMLAKVSANNALMTKHGFNGTPTVLYTGKHEGDETVFLANGVPNIREMFQRLGVSGQLDVLSKDPSLSRYLN